MDSLEIKIFDTTDELHARTAEYILKLISKIIGSSQYCTLSLSGGTSPGKIYEIMGQTSRDAGVDWNSVHMFWGDERCVDPAHKLSNYRMVNESLISRIDIPNENVHRIKGELGPESGAREYERELKEFFPNDNLPRLDILLLGLGEDAHTASLFPLNDALKEETKWAVAVQKDDGPGRITVTLPVINNAATVIFIVAGEKKAEAVYRVFFDSFQPDKYPAHSVKPANGNLFWFMDRSAATLYLEKSGKKN